MRSTFVEIILTVKEEAVFTTLNLELHWATVCVSNKGYVKFSRNLYFRT